MLMAVQGTNRFDDYNVFMRAMYTALHTMKDTDKEIYIYSAGPVKVNNMALEFSNITESSLKARGIRIQTRRVTTKWLEDNMNSIDYLAFFSKPGEPFSKLVDVADSHKVEAQVYSYA